MLITIWMWVFVSVLYCHAEVPDTFSVVVPDGPVSAKLGSSVVLPCSLSPSFSAVELEVRWYRPSKFKTPVLLYKDQKIQESPVDPQYGDRVSLIGRLEEGNVSLKLENITLSDRGKYEGHISSANWYERCIISLTINVLGSLPVLSFTETGGGYLNVTCVSDGWSPQPTVTWRDREGKEIKQNSNVMYKTDSDDLVSVSSWLLFSPSESEWISCSVSLSDQEKREGRVIPVRTKMSTASKTEHLTLDTSTCHEHLTVNKGRKEVTYQPRKKTNNKNKQKQKAKENEASNLMLDVLCEKKFDSGVHYWEVIVLDEEKAVPPKLSWYVGVTSHEKQRKKEPLTPENGYWVLQYERGKGFYVNTGLPSPVLVRDLFSTLGVYLDMKKNTLSFYDVDSKSHLYTFTEVKSERNLIPLLSPGALGHRSRLHYSFCGEDCCVARKAKKTPSLPATESDSEQGESEESDRERASENRAEASQGQDQGGSNPFSPGQMT
ncbi:butyrophilin subfamily 1 member A1-like [Chanos chanos]|uniref:Butyrophilin subfamily 1 member A1-like n=1 Tax=Chanos chanos TaxID=29144 RepID=A0A6J2WK82_CHACN|nr:butyrophilin subfamily 1 member A1-like [Chanos chanos]